MNFNFKHFPSIWASSTFRLKSILAVPLNEAVHLAEDFFAGVSEHLRAERYTDIMVCFASFIGKVFAEPTKQWYLLGSTRCKDSVRWQHLSPMKNVLLFLDETIFSIEKRARLSTGVGSASYN